MANILRIVLLFYQNFREEILIRRDQYFGAEPFWVHLRLRDFRFRIRIDFVSWFIFGTGIFDFVAESTLSLVFIEEG